MEVPDCPFYLRHTLSLAMLDLTISCFDQEPLVFMPLCVPWLSFLCACGCRRPREGRSRKLRFHSAEATREGKMFWDQASWSKSEITPMWYKAIPLGRWIQEFCSILAAMCLFGCIILCIYIYVHCTIWCYGRRWVCLYVYKISWNGRRHWTLARVCGGQQFVYSLEQLFICLVKYRWHIQNDKFWVNKSPKLSVTASTI
jgi:hypothetical protein